MTRAATSAASAASNPPLSAACMRRVDPLVAKSSAEIRNRGRDELGPGPAPHHYLKELCLEPVTPTPTCQKAHYHAAADQCVEYGTTVGDIADEEFGPGTLRCLQRHYHGWFPEATMRRILRSEQRPKQVKKDDFHQGEEVDGRAVLEDVDAMSNARDSSGFRFDSRSSPDRRFSTSSSDPLRSPVAAEKKPETSGDAFLRDSQRLPSSSSSSSSSEVQLVAGPNSLYAASRATRPPRPPVPTGGHVARPRLPTCWNPALATYGPPQPPSVSKDSETEECRNSGVDSGFRASPAFPAETPAATTENRDRGRLPEECAASSAPAFSGCPVEPIDGEHATVSKPRETSAAAKITTTFHRPPPAEKAFLSRDVRLQGRDTGFDVIVDNAVKTSSPSDRPPTLNADDTRQKAFSVVKFRRDDVNQSVQGGVRPSTQPFCVHESRATFQSPPFAFSPSAPVRPPTPQPRSSPFPLSPPVLPSPPPSYTLPPPLPSPPNSLPPLEPLSPSPFVIPPPPSFANPLSNLPSVQEPSHAPSPPTSSSPPPVPAQTPIRRPSVAPSHPTPPPSPPPLVCPVHRTEYHRKFSPCSGNCVENKRLMEEKFRELGFVKIKQSKQSCSETTAEADCPPSKKLDDPFHLKKSMKNSDDSNKKHSKRDEKAASSRHRSPGFDKRMKKSLSSRLPMETVAEKMNRFLTTDDVGAKGDCRQGSKEITLRDEDEDDEDDDVSAGLSARGFARRNARGENSNNDAAHEADWSTASSLRPDANNGPPRWKGHDSGAVTSSVSVDVFVSFSGGSSSVVNVKSPNDFRVKSPPPLSKLISSGKAFTPSPPEHVAPFTAGRDQRSDVQAKKKAAFSRAKLIEDDSSSVIAWASTNPAPTPFSTQSKDFQSPKGDTASASNVKSKPHASEKSQCYSSARIPEVDVKESTGARFEGQEPPWKRSADDSSSVIAWASTNPVPTLFSTQSKDFQSPKGDIGSASNVKSKPHASEKSQCYSSARIPEIDVKGSAGARFEGREPPWKCSADDSSVIAWASTNPVPTLFSTQSKDFQSPKEDTASASNVKSKPHASEKSQCYSSARIPEVDVKESAGARFEGREPPWKRSAEKSSTISWDSARRALCKPAGNQSSLSMSWPKGDQQKNSRDHSKAAPPTVKLTDFVPPDEGRQRTTVQEPQPKYSVPPNGPRRSKGNNPTANVRLRPPEKTADWSKDIPRVNPSANVLSMKPVKLTSEDDDSDEIDLVALARMVALHGPGAAFPKKPTAAGGSSSLASGGAVAGRGTGPAPAPLSTPSRRPSSRMRAVRDRSDGFCVRVLNVPPTVTHKNVRNYVADFQPALTRTIAKDVLEARFATEAEAVRFSREFDWRRVETDG